MSYKLLRYINSAGFGLMCEIQSFRHAVSILGYDKLNKLRRCCSLRQAATSAAPALMQTAIARAAFMEQIGAAFFDKGELDNLFITGAFSMLHLLLGAKPAVGPRRMHLPDADLRRIAHRRRCICTFPGARAGAGKLRRQAPRRPRRQPTSHPSRSTGPIWKPWLSPTARSSVEREAAPTQQ